MGLEEKIFILDSALLRYYDYNLSSFAFCNIKHLEVGFGNGEFLLNFALQRENECFFGIEYSKKYFLKAQKRFDKYKLKNIKIIYGEAYTLISSIIPDSFFDFIHINFPDPWPKKRHSRRRLLNLDFIKEIERVLKPNGKVFLVSDVFDYFLNSVSNFQKCNLLLEYFSNTPYPERVSKSKYEKEFLRLEKKIFYSVLKKT